MNNGVSPADVANVGPGNDLAAEPWRRDKAAANGRW